MENALWFSRIKVRHLTRADLPALEWEGEFTHFRRLYMQAYQRAQKNRSVLWVAELPSEGLIGQLFVQLISARLELADGECRAYIYSFRIRPSFRGYGLGTHMLRLAEQDLRRRGFQIATLNVNRSNAEARRLYERNGYRVVAAESGRWTYRDQSGNLQKVNEPAWRMQKEL